MDSVVADEKPGVFFRWPVCGRTASPRCAKASHTAFPVHPRRNVLSHRKLCELIPFNPQRTGGIFVDPEERRSLRNPAATGPFGWLQYLAVTAQQPDWSLPTLPEETAQIASLGVLKKLAQDDAPPSLWFLKASRPESTVLE